MSRIRTKTEQRGFTLIELLTALGIFLLVCGAAFTLLGTSQQRYQTDAQVLNSFQEARLGLDQIVRDVNDSEENAHELARLMKGHLYHVNLIPYNTTPGASYAGTEQERIWLQKI